MSSERLTGRTRVRRGWFGKLILQLEHEWDEHTSADAGNYDHEWYTEREWRDATIEDYVLHVTSQPVQTKPEPPREREREYPTNIKPLTVPRNNGLAPTAGPKGKLP